jgi:hypothetical protein
MSLTKLSLAGKNLTIPVQGEFGLGHPGWERENGYIFLQCTTCTPSFEKVPCYVMVLNKLDDKTLPEAL